MKAEEFDKIVNEQLKRSIDVLLKKADEYATSDRLHNFKVSAAMQGLTSRQALAGMMAKHTTSIYDMIHSCRSFPIEVWNEKITDHINYLLLLRAIVEEDNDSNPK